MSEATRVPQQSQGATPPGGGAQDHESMRAASMRPVSGPATTDDRAAGGGLQVPGREVHAARPEADAAAPVHEPIPGERDPTNQTHRQPGGMGGHWAGGDNAYTGSDATLSKETTDEAARDGGGSPSQRRT